VIADEALTPQPQPEVKKKASKPSAIEKTMQKMGIKGIKDKAIIKSTDTFTLSFGKILSTIIVLMLVGLVIKVVSGILNTISERKDNWRLFIKRIIPIFRIGTWTFAIYFVIQVIIAPPIETLFAVITSAGVAVGFASQDILKKPISVIFVNEMFEHTSMIVMNIKAYVYDIRAEFKLKSDITKTTIRELSKAGIISNKS